MFLFDYEDGGNFHFYIGENTFKNSYILYLQRTRLYICDPNIRISDGLQSYKSLDKFLSEEYQRRIKL